MLKSFYTIPYGKCIVNTENLFFLSPLPFFGALPSACQIFLKTQKEAVQSKSDKKLVVVKSPEGQIETGIKKFGAMLGDEVEVGCGTVLNPGSVVGSHSNIYPLSSVRGFVPANSIYKKQGEVVEKY